MSLMRNVIDSAHLIALGKPCSFAAYADIGAIDGEQVITVGRAVTLIRSGYAAAIEGAAEAVRGIEIVMLGGMGVTGNGLPDAPPTIPAPICRHPSACFCKA